MPMLRAVAAVSTTAGPAFGNMCKAMSLHLLCGGAKARRLTSKLSGTRFRSRTLTMAGPAAGRVNAIRT